MRIALITCQDYMSLSVSDRLMLEPLKNQGIEPVIVAWDDPAVDWQTFDTVILRSTWDYHRKPQAFRQWIQRMADLNVNLHNDVQTVRWNLEKTYLRQLEQAGITIIPTVWLARDMKASLTDLLTQNQWSDAVLKPTIGASADGIQVVSLEKSTEQQSILDVMLQSGGVMLQPVMKEIQEGEISLIFFNQQFSYAVRKLTGSGTIFVNAAYGGTQHAIEVSDQVIQTGQRVLATASHLAESRSILYARVDGIMVEGRFMLMELEVIDPGLYLNLSPSNGVPDFVRAIVESAR